MSGYNLLYRIIGAMYWRFRDYTDPYLGKLRRKGLKELRITIISNNCWGGHFYRYFGLNYQSPTIGLYFFMDDYIKFIYNLKYYMNQELKFINWDKSKYASILQSKGETNVPIGTLGDVEIVFLHYHSIEEARTKWNRRKERINWDNIWYKFSEMGGCQKKHIEAFAALPTDKKILFAAHKYDYDFCIFWKEWNKVGHINDDTSLFNKGVNLKRLINKR